MNVRELYFEYRDATNLAMRRICKPSSSPELGSPEILLEDILEGWLAVNYLVATGFKPNGDPIMGEIGGVVPTHPKTGYKVLAISDPSMGKVSYGIEKIKEAERTGDYGIISDLEAQIEMPLETRGNVAIVNGNRNAGHYDFTSSAARDDPLDTLTTNTTLLLGAEGFTVLSNKHLSGEQYIFNIPTNPYLFERLKEADGAEDSERRLDILRQSKDMLVPDDFIAGFHIFYKENNIVIVRPVIGERESLAHSGYLERSGLPRVVANINYLGTSDSYGQLTGIIDNPLH